MNDVVRGMAAVATEFCAIKEERDALRAARTRLYDAIGKADYALWVMLEHSALHFGDKHSNTIIAREALHELRAAVSEQHRAAASSPSPEQQGTNGVPQRVAGAQEGGNSNAQS